MLIRNSRIVLAALVVLLAASTGLREREKRMEITVPSPEEILKRLRHGHPRLLAAAQDFAQVKQRAASDPLARRWYEHLRGRADHMLAEAPSRYEIPDGLRLLSTSRRVLDRVYTLALLYRVEGDRKYAERAWGELHAAAGFPDWNPRHFLDTAEMTHAFAIGYDWLYDFWSPEQRATLRAAMVEKGLKPALESYRGTASFGRWVKMHHNWNQVCNGGIGMGALAIGDKEPPLAGEILHGALESLPLAMAHFAPDGAWDEGPGYWNYATFYNVVFLAALDTALGTDFGLSQFPGFAQTGDFPLYLTGPLGRTFNFADGGDSPIRGPQLFWLARKFDRPIDAWYQRQVAAPHALDLLWFDPRGESPREAGLPRDRHFRGVDAATFRSAWSDPDALFVGFKAGDNRANHSHLDLGSFVLDALGTGWAVDLGADNYNLPAYFGKQRWSYYRLRAEGHNTLVIDPGEEPDQKPTAAASIVRFSSEPGRSFAITDLTAAYAAYARKVQRGVMDLSPSPSPARGGEPPVPGNGVDTQASPPSLAGKGAGGLGPLLVQDEIEAEKPVEVWWFMHTPAEAQVSEDGASAMLTHGSARLWARILSPAEAKFTVRDAQPLPTSSHPEGQAKNEGVRKLAVHLSGVTRVWLAVLLVPLREAEAVPSHLPALVPLAEW